MTGSPSEVMMMWSSKKHIWSQSPDPGAELLKPLEFPERFIKSPFEHICVYADEMMQGNPR